MVKEIWKRYKKNGFITPEEEEYLKVVSERKNGKNVATKDAKIAQEILWHLSGEPFKYYNVLNLLYEEK